MTPTDEATILDPYRLTADIENLDDLDRLAGTLDGWIPAVMRHGPLRDGLAGRWLGHALHPVLTDVPVGTWTAATVLDVVGPRRWQPASATLTGVGVVAAVPTAATGLVEFLDLDSEQRRTAVVHALANAAALGCYTVSLVAKLSGRHGIGRLAAIAGAAATLVGGYLGGHLSYARGAGVDRTVQQRERRDWFRVVGDDRTAGLQAVSGEHYLVVGTGPDRTAVPDRCTRCAGPLQRSDGEVVVCPRDGSRFAVRAGRVLDGPATTPLPTFDVAEVDGALRLRRSAPPT